VVKQPGALLCRHLQLAIPTQDELEALLVNEGVVAAAKKIEVREVRSAVE